VYERTQFTKLYGYPNKKYVIQARYALSGGVHLSEHTMDPKGWKRRSTFIYEDDLLFYYHYHDTINHQDELCKEFVDPKQMTMKIDGVPHALVDSIAKEGDAVRKFELQSIGPQEYML
jgi:hypothetical protein